MTVLTSKVVSSGFELDSASKYIINRLSVTGIADHKQSPENLPC